MTRPEFLSPRGKLTPEICRNALLLVYPDPPPLEVMEQWTSLECLLAYDWAMRTHLRASDNLLHHRGQPWFLLLARGKISLPGPPCCGWCNRLISLDSNGQWAATHPADPDPWNCYATGDGKHRPLATSERKDDDH